MKKTARKKLLWAVMGILLTGIIQAQGPIDFTLYSATDDSRFTLSEARGQYVALHFLLKTECPYCMRHTQDYFQKAASLPNVKQVFIKPDAEAEIAKWAGDKLDNEAGQYPIYRDPEAQLAGKYNIPDGYAFHGQVVHYPAMVLLDPEGKEIFRYVGKNNRDRFSFEQLMEKMAELTE